MYCSLGKRTPIFGLALEILANAFALNFGDVDKAGAVAQLLRGEGLVVEGAVYEDRCIWKEERGDMPGEGVEVKVDMDAGNHNRCGRCIPSI